MRNKEKTKEVKMEEMIKKFKKPKYWAHLAIVVIVLLGLLQIIFGGDMLNLRSILISIPLLAIGETVAHQFVEYD
jgi:hypothetical protein